MGFIYYGSTSRCDSLALGILLALFADRLPRLTRGARLLLLAGGLAGWVVSSAWLNEQPGPVDMRMVLGRLMVSLAAGAILYACLHSHSKLVRGAWVVRLGKISYGLYMLHLTGILIMLSLFRPVWGWQLLATKGLGFVHDGHSRPGLVSLGRVALPAAEGSVSQPYSAGPSDESESPCKWRFLVDKIALQPSHVVIAASPLRLPSSRCGR